MTFVWLC